MNQDFHQYNLPVNKEAVPLQQSVQDVKKTIRDNRKPYILQKGSDTAVVIQSIRGGGDADNELPDAPVLNEASDSVTLPIYSLDNTGSSADTIETIAGTVEVDPAIDAELQAHALVAESNRLAEHGRHSLERVDEALEKTKPILEALAAPEVTTRNFTEDLKSHQIMVDAGSAKIIADKPRQGLSEWVTSFFTTSPKPLEKAVSALGWVDRCENLDYMPRTPAQQKANTPIRTKDVGITELRQCVTELLPNNEPAQRYALTMLGDYYNKTATARERYCPPGEECADSVNFRANYLQDMRTTEGLAGNERALASAVKELEMQHEKQRLVLTNVFISLSNKYHEKINSLSVQKAEVFTTMKMIEEGLKACRSDLQPFIKETTSVKLGAWNMIRQLSQNQAIIDRCTENIKRLEALVETLESTTSNLKVDLASATAARDACQHAAEHNLGNKVLSFIHRLLTWYSLLILAAGVILVFTYIYITESDRRRVERREIREARRAERLEGRTFLRKALWIIPDMISSMVDVIRQRGERDLSRQEIALLRTGNELESQRVNLEETRIKYSWKKAILDFLRRK